MKKRLQTVLSSLLCICLLVGLLPLGALAAAAEDDEPVFEQGDVGVVGIVPEEPVEEPAAEAADTLSMPQGGLTEEPAEAALLEATDMASAEYTIYPLPREITYANSAVTIPETVNVVYGGDIDEFTKDHLVDALAPLNVSVSVKDAPQAGAFNILVGVRGSGDAGDTALAGVDSTMTISHKGSTYNEDIFTSTHAFDAYIIRVDESGIAIAGKDTDAAFYAITTLKHIFAQTVEMGAHAVRSFTMRDYASVAFRGFIEGYYGLPWSHDSRKMLMEWGGEWKMNMYVFAPKDDPYHRELWKELYPTEALQKQIELAETGNRTKNRYVYALHPFSGTKIKLDDANFNSEVAFVTAKFDQLYDVGVRQFAILADDSGTDNGQQLAKLMNALNAWRKTKEGVYPLMVCPENYNESWTGSDNAKQSKADLNYFLDDDVEVFWTGKGVCGHATADDANAFANVIAKAADTHGKVGRKPLMWLNWPVDDINMKRLLLGPGSNEGGANGYSTSVAVLKQGEADYFTGIISNPMQQAALNKIPLFAVADYTWNDDDYNGQQSWADSFQFVDPDATEALHTLAKHMCDPNPNSHGMNCGESEELKDQLSAFLAAYPDGDWQGLVDPLIAEFEIIAKACDDFDAQSQDAQFKEEIDSHRRSLKDLSESAIALLRTTKTLAAGEVANTWSNYSEGTAKKSSAQTYPIPLINGGVQYAEPGAKRLVPFVNSLAEKLATPVQELMNPDYEPPVTPGIYISSRLKTWEGTPSNAMDGDLNTYYWIHSKVETYGDLFEGEYVGIGFETPITIKQFRVLGTKPGNTNDYFRNAVLEYRVKGEKEFKPVPDESNGVFNVAEKTWDFSDAPLTNVVDVRARLLADQNPWVCLREFGPYDPDDEPVEGAQRVKYTATGYKTDNMNGGTANPLANMVDDNMSSLISVYHTGPSGTDQHRDHVCQNDAVWVDLGSVKTIGNISITCKQGNHMTHAALEYSSDGTNYNVLQDNISTAKIEYDCSGDSVSARYIRLRNSGACQSLWLEIYDFSVEAPYSPVFRSEDLVYGHLDESYGPDRKMVDEDDSTYVWYGSGETGGGNPPEGAFVGLRLPKKIALGRIRILQGTSSTNGDKFANATLQYSDDGGTTYHDILTNINENDLDIDLSASGIKATHVRLVNGPGCSTWAAFRTFSVEEATSSANTPIDTNVTAYAERMCTVGYDTAAIGAMVGEITLGAGEYIGIKLPRIRELNGLTVSGNVPSGLTLMAGCNELELKEVASGSLTEDNRMNARYVRLVNKGTDPVTFTFAGLNLTSHEIQTPSIVSSAMGGSADGLNPANLFDGDLGTEYGWAAKPTPAGSGNQNSVIDIGQVMHIDSLQFIVNDSQKDWIRHAKVEGSLSPNGPWAYLVEIGSASAPNSINDSTSGWTHTISYNYSGSKPGDEPLGVDARYLKVTLLPYNGNALDIWSRVREIGINNLLVGNEYTRPYMAAANDPTFECPNEVQGHPATNLTDGNVSTTYIPSINNGSLLYRLSEDLESVNQLSIFQSPSTLSNAKVEVRAANQTDFVEIGKLTYSMNEFLLPSSAKPVAEVKITWAGMAPELHEIMAIRAEPAPVDKAALDAALAKITDFEASEEYHLGLDTSKSAYLAAKLAAQAAKDSETMLQSGVDKAASDLEAAMETVKNTVPVGNIVLPDNQHSVILYTNPAGSQSSTVTLTPTVNPSVASDKTLVWTSDNEAVATVDGATETVTAHKAGTAAITIASKSNPTVQTTCAVTVKTNITGISVKDGDTPVAEGGVVVIYNNKGTSAVDGKRNSATLTAVLTPEDATEVALTWERTDGTSGLISKVPVANEPAKMGVVATGVNERDVGEKTVEVKSVSNPTVKATFKIRVLRYLVHDVTVSVENNTAPKPGKTVMVNINQLNLDEAGVTGLKYQWYRGTEPITDETNSTYVLAEADIGKEITAKVTATPTDTYFYEGERTSNALTVEAKTAPAAPELTATPVDGDTKGTITITGYTAGTAYEISTDGGKTWNDATVDGNGMIGDLAAGDYQVRLKATEDFDAGHPATISIKDITKTYYAVSYTIAGDGEGEAVLSKTDVEKGTSVSLTVTSEPGFAVKSVTVGGEALEGTDGENGAKVYTVENVQAEVEFTVTFEAVTYTITHVLTNGLSCSKAAGSEVDSHEVAYGTKEVITLVAAEGISLPDRQHITVKKTANGEAFDAYDYSPETGIITITGGVTEDLTIEAAGEVTKYQIAHKEMLHVTCGLEDHTVAHKAALTIDLDADQGYILPETIIITMAGEPLTAGTDYTYTRNANKTSAQVIFEEGKITGKLEISVTAEKNLIQLESVSISGKAQVGQLLEAHVTPESAANDVNYQWLWVAEDGTETAIDGAIGMRRQITVRSLDKRIAVRVTPDDDSAYTGSVTSLPTVAVIAEDAPTIPVENVTLDKTSATLKPEETVKITASVFPDTATDQSVTWASEDETIATVDANGLITAVKEGTVVITATANDDPTKQATCTITVKVPKPSRPGTGGTTTGNTTGTTTTETKEDGTTVTTTKKHDGTVTQVTETPDGTKETVETKVDGTVTETVETPEGSKTEKVTTPEKDVTITVTDPEGEKLAEVTLPAEIAEPETKFEDVPETHWAEKAINTMASLGVVNGVGGNKYDTTSAMTRGSLATVLHRLSNGKTDYEVVFTDVAKDKFYADGVAWAAKAGVVTGISETEFAPEKVITREQLAVMLTRYAKLLGMDTKADAKSLDQFTDGTQTGAWAVDGMAWCVENGILQGKGRNDLDPTAEVSRAEVAVMLDRFIALVR